MTDNVIQNDKPIIIATAGGMNPQVAINALARQFTNIVVVTEDPESKLIITKRRAKRLGWFNALGQLATMALSRFAKSFARKRQAEILQQYGLSGEPNKDIRVEHVASLNTPDFLAIVDRINPAAILTISCRILSAKTLNSIACPVINFHSGINPAYRGQMGGYWAAAEGDMDNFGSTVHLVDPGVDTGDTLYEKRLLPAPSDTMLTIPLLLTAASTDIMARALHDAVSGNLKPYQQAGPSSLRYPPTIGTYLRNGLTKGIW